MTTKLFLIRHGQSLGNVDEDIYKKIPDWQIPLTEVGQIQATAAGAKLNTLLTKSPIIIHSPWQRAKQTMQEIVNNLNLKPKKILEDPLIHEQSICHSHESMRLKEDYYCEAKYQYGEFWYKTKDSESFADTYLRARQFLNDLRWFILNNPDEEIVIVSHGVFLMLFIAALNNQSVDDILKENLPYNCQVIEEQM